MPWQIDFLDALLELDRSESPHGLYAIRWAYTKNPNDLPPMAEILKSPKRTDFIRKLGFETKPSNLRENILSFVVNNTHNVEMKILDYASTKVRHFGSVYRLDPHNRKQPSEPEWSLEKLLPKLTNQGEHNQRTESSSRSILLLAHAPTLEEILLLLGKTREESFLKKYSLALFTRDWKDRYNRLFHSAAYLWSG